MPAFYSTFFIAALALISSSLTNAYDPDPLQDFCVAVNASDTSVFVNGRICKDPKTVTVNDFVHTGMNIPGNITAPLGSKVSPAFVDQLPGLNTLGISIVRVDYAVGGLNPPHYHPRATEILLVLEGKLYAGFISSNPANPLEKNKLFARIMNPGDAIVFPKGLIHFQYNVGKTNAVAIASLNSQNPGIVHLGKAAFGSDPPLNPDVLAKGFQLDKQVVEHLQSLPWPGND